MKTLFIATVGEFYKQRAGFFLTIILIAFGFMGGREHQAIASFLISDFTGLTILAGTWLLYTLMCSVFWNALWVTPQYSFVYHARLMTASRRIVWLLLLSAGLLIPVFLYGGWIIRTAIAEGNAIRSLSIAALSLILLSGLTVWADWRLKHQNVSARATKNAGALRFKRPVSSVFWTTEWLFREKALTLLLSKAGTALFTIATLIYYGTDEYDIRLPAVGLSLSVLMNIGLSYEIFRWETEILAWARSLPIPFLKKISNLAAVHLLVLLPDSLLVIRYGYSLLSIAELAQLCLLQLSIVLWYHSHRYRTEKSLEDSLGVVFRMFIGLTLLILYKIPLIILSVILLAYAAWSYRRSIN